MKRARWIAVALVGLLAFAFQGSRGLWEPDEGFYGGAAAELLTTGTWLVPTLQGKPFLDKPPLVYWAGKAGMMAFGHNEWGLRALHALAFLLAAAGIGRLGRKLWDERTGVVALLAYGTMLVPFVAANVFTPDTLLAAGVIGMFVGYVEAETATHSAGRLLGWVGAGLAAGLGMLAKGPALLVFAPPILVHLLLRRRLLGALAQPGPWLGAALALGLAAPWYLWVATSIPGAATYLYDNQVLGRLVEDTYSRNDGPWGGVAVYVPVLLLGSLPWCAFLVGPAWRWSRRLVRPTLAGFRQASNEPRGGIRPALLLALWTALPLAVLLFALSRLPFYVLPIFGAIALAAARAVVSRPRFAGGFDWRTLGVGRRVAISGWVLLLLAIKGAGAVWETPADSRALARLVMGIGSDGPCEVVAVSTRRNGLGFYRAPGFEWADGLARGYPYFAPLESLDEEIAEAEACLRPHVFVVAARQLPALQRRLRRAALGCSERTGLGDQVLVVCTGGGSPAAADAGTPGLGSSVDTASHPRPFPHDRSPVRHRAEPPAPER